jgi:hypothetical protein
VKSWLGSGGRIVGPVQGGPDRRPDLVWQFLYRHAAGQRRREGLGGHLGEPFRKRLGEHHRDLLGPDAPREQPLARLLVLERLGQHVVQQEDLDAPRAHQVDEGVVLLSRAAHPDHVVEEELVRIRRREPLVCEVGPVHHHRVELSDLRVRPQGRVGGGAHPLSPFRSGCGKAALTHEGYLGDRLASSG